MAPEAAVCGGGFRGLLSPRRVRSVGISLRLALALVLGCLMMLRDFDGDEARSPGSHLMCCFSMEQQADRYRGSIPAKGESIQRLN